MEKSKGKCKTCFGCNKLEERGFKGVNYCKYYVKAEDDERVVYLILLIEIVLYMMFLGYFYYRFSMLCGG